MKKLNTLNDLEKLDDKSIHLILKYSVEDLIVKVLKGASPSFKDKIFSNYSESAINDLEKSMEETGSVPVDEINRAYEEMLKTANRVLKTEKTKIALASDHAGFEMKEFMKDYLKDDCEVQDFGAYDTSSMDYPDSGFPAAEAVARGKCELGIIICGSGIGMSIVANKVDGVRAALCHCTDFAKLSRMHNNANVLVLSGRFIAKHLAFEMVDLFLNTPYEGGRHDKRLNKIRDYEERGKYENN